MKSIKCSGCGKIVNLPLSYNEFQVKLTMVTAWFKEARGHNDVTLINPTIGYHAQLADDCELAQLRLVELVMEE